ncbi:ribonuclease [Kitasatospora sp. CB01950]|uniref:ribonuclease n=1 Tax=Kitasatospora sp. CB01950 TaxID=1703930 RepID=UPI0009F937B8|nr:ribonuclease [Kitasatospora sp. CB01950]
MSSRNRLISLVVLVVAGLVAAVTALLNDGADTGSPSAAKSPSAAPAATATRSGTASAPKPSPPAKPSADQPTWVPTSTALADVCRSKLPSQALDTLSLVAKGGPYPYRSDGIVFENRESLLPRQSNGYYHEFTVVTPGSDDRGTRRVVTGNAGEQYWTADHYGSFQEIDSRC